MKTWKAIAGLLAIATIGIIARPPAPARAEDVPVTGTPQPGLEPFDTLMTTFVKEHRVPGAALAIARRGRLVYSRGFGFADRDACEPVRPDSLFRIASISKPITAVAVLQLVGRGLLALDDSVIDVLGIVPGQVPGGRIDPRWRKVTIRHLLQHTSGWDSPKRDRSPVDIARALGIEPPAAAADVARWTLGQPLDAEPGTRYAYANFGYCLLGRVIEGRGGMPYEEYVRLRVLAPLGITRMRIAEGDPRDRLPGEVRYLDARGREGKAEYGAIGRTVPLAYYMNMPSMDAFGGWLASAEDLARFSSAFRRGAPRPPLGPDLFGAMLAAPDGAVGHESDGRAKLSYYGCGWVVNPRGNGGVPYFWHAGGLSGSSTLLVHRHGDEFDYAVLFNTDADAKGTPLSTRIEHPLNVTIDAIADWPDIDGFARDPAPSAPPGDS